MADVVPRIEERDPQGDFRRLAIAVVNSGVKLYGLPESGPTYENNLTHLLDPKLHDFRLMEIPEHTGDRNYLQRQRSILDLGCGPGTMVCRALGFGHDAWGIDLDERKIELARCRVDAQGQPEVWKSRMVVGDATDLPFDDQSFDIVSSWQVLEHIESVAQALFEAVRVTKKGGWLDLRAPDYRQSFDNHYAMAWPRFMPRSQALRWTQAMGRPADGVGTFFYVTMPQIQAILEGLGCRIVSATLYLHGPFGAKKRFTGVFGHDPILFTSGTDVSALAREIQRLEREERLPEMYCRPLEFVVIAQRR